MKAGILLPGDRELASSLGLATRRRYAGLAAGEQRSPAVGGGIEFADYREYLPGDDPRAVDWAVYRRLGKLLVRICAEERELTLMILLDASRSMDHGEPGKLGHARRLACILAGIAIGGGNRAGLCSLGPGLIEALRPERGKASLEGFEGACARLLPLAEFRPAEALDGFVARYGRRCVAVLISDLMFPEWPQVLGALAASGCEAQVLQVLSRDELDPAVRGETTFVDAETMREAPIHADAATLMRYANELEGFLGSVRRTCGGLGLGWALAPTDGDVARLFRDELCEGGFLC